MTNPEVLPDLHRGTTALAEPGTNGKAPFVQPAPKEESTLDAMKHYVRAMRRHWWVVLGAAVLGLGVAGWIAYNSPPAYRAGAVIRLTDTRRGIAGGLGGLPAAPVSLNGNPMASQIEVLKSRSVAAMVASTQGLRLVGVTRNFPLSVLDDVSLAPETTIDSLHFQFEDARVVARGGRETVTAAYGEPLIVNGVHLVVTRKPEVETASAVIVPSEVAAAQLQNAIEAQVRPNTDVVDVTYVARDPILAQRVVNSLVESFQEFNASGAQREARRRREFVEGQLARTEQMLLQAQADLTEFRRDENAFSSRERYVSRQAGLDEVTLEIARLRANQRTYQTLLQELQQGPSEERNEAIAALAADPNFATNPLVAPLYQQLTEYETSRDTLVGRLAPTNPDLQRLNGQIANTRARLVGAVNSYIESLGAQVSSLENLRTAGAGDLATLPAAEAQEVRLVSRAEYLSSIAEELRREFHQAEIDEAVQGGQVEIVDPALPGVPVAGGRIRTTVFGLVLGLAMGGGLAVLLEGLNTSIRRRREIEEVLHVPELAVVPAFQAGGDGGKRRVSVPALRNGNGARKEGGGRDELVAATQLHSSAAEAYRTLRTNLIFSQSVTALRTLVVTSSAPGEGKSTTAANVAVAFAQQGMRVLLVDCDLRKARLHKMFGVPREPGFTNVVLGLADADEVIRETSVPGLSFLAAGTTPPNPAELVGGRPAQQAVRALTEKFELVVIDSPPLLAAPDASILGRFVDGVLLVVRAGSTERDAATLAMNQLQSVGAHVFGAVLNDPDSKVAQYGGHYAYEYYGSEG